MSEVGVQGGGDAEDGETPADELAHSGSWGWKPREGRQLLSQLPSSTVRTSGATRPSMQRGGESQPCNHLPSTSEGPAKIKAGGAHVLKKMRAWSSGIMWDQIFSSLLGTRKSVKPVCDFMEERIKAEV